MAHTPNPKNTITTETIPPITYERAVAPATHANLNSLLSIAFCMIETELKTITKKTTFDNNSNSGASKNVAI